jgi:hypothetical protein
MACLRVSRLCSFPPRLSPASSAHGLCPRTLLCRFVVSSPSLFSPASVQLPNVAEFGTAIAAETEADSLSSSSSGHASAAAVAGDNAIREGPRKDWAREEIQAIYDSPLMDLLFYGVRFFLLFALLL